MEDNKPEFLLPGENSEDFGQRIIPRSKSSYRKKYLPKVKVELEYIPVIQHSKEEEEISKWITEITDEKNDKLSDAEYFEKIRHHIVKQAASGEIGMTLYLMRPRRSTGMKILSTMMDAGR